MVPSQQAFPGTQARGYIFPLKPPALTWRSVPPLPALLRPPSLTLAMASWPMDQAWCPAQRSSTLRAIRGTRWRCAPSQVHMLKPGAGRFWPLPLLCHEGRDGPSSQGPAPHCTLGCSHGQRILFHGHSCPSPALLRSWALLLISHCISVGLGSFSVWMPGPCCGLWLGVLTSQRSSTQPHGCWPCLGPENAGSLPPPAPTRHPPQATLPLSPLAWF